MSIAFEKYHGLGNDYLVLDPANWSGELSEERIERICHRNYGLGSDGILFGPLPSDTADFRLQIFNPDGSEAEKSGNGLRIFARYLHDTGRVTGEPFTVETLGGVVECTVSDPRDSITVEMGSVSFDAARIPVKGLEGEVLQQEASWGGESFKYSAATVGNPHCVVLLDNIDEALARRIGPLIENDPRFPHRTNVQFLKVIDRKRIQIEIWERGAGYTLASGSSSSAAGAVARRLGLVENEIEVHMPGGIIELKFDDAFNVRMTGPVTRVAHFELEEECLS